MCRPKGLARSATARATWPKAIRPEGHAAQSRDFQQGRPPLGPAPVAHHPVLLDQPAMGGEDQGHRMVGDLLNEGVGAIGDRDALGGRRLDIDRVDPDAAERDDFAALQPVDHLSSDRPALGIERVGLLGGGGEFILGASRDLVDLGVDRRQRLHLVAVAAAGDGKAGTRRCRDPVLGQYALRFPANSQARSDRCREGLSIADRRGRDIDRLDGRADVLSGTLD